MQYNNELFWITGGYKNNSVTNDTEFLMVDNLFKYISAVEGPEFPIYSINHCIVKLNSTLFVITGGSMTNLTTLYIYRTNLTFKFHEGPKLLNERSCHTCGTFTLLGKKMVIVSGGIGAGGVVKTTEILDITSNYAWSKGKMFINTSALSLIINFSFF